MPDTSWKKRRGGIRSTVTRDVNGIIPMLRGDVALEPAKLRSIHKRLQHNLDRLYDLDEKVQNELMEVDKSADADADVTDAEKYNDTVLNTMVQIEGKLHDYDVSQAPAAPTAQPAAVHPAAPLISATQNAQVRLPKFEMATYSGDPMGWQPFWDVYKAAIHDSKMKPVEKFSYLLGYLDGDALAMASGYSITEANYDHVINQLQERFGNKQRAQFAHYQALIALEPAKNKSLAEVRRVSDGCEMHIRSLVGLGADEAQFGVVFTSIILSKLPEYLATKLCEKTGRSDWTLANVREWIKDDMFAREMGESSFKGTNVNGSNGTRRKPEQVRDGKPSSTTSALPAPGGGSQSGGNFKQNLCVFCNRDTHESENCKTHSDLDGRYDILRSSRRCFQCLMEGHGRPHCRKNYPCSSCSRRGHHSSLCPDQPWLQKVGSSSYSGQSKTWTRRDQRKPASKFSKPVEDKRDDKRATPKKTTSSVAVAQADECEQVDVSFLQTALAQVTDESGRKEVKARLFLDTASSKTYIREGLRRELGLEAVGTTHISIGRFGTMKRTTQRAEQVRVNVMCRDGSIQPVLAIVTPIISCPVARVPIDPVEYPIVNEIPLAEPLNSVPDTLDIDLLIGNDQYYNFMSSGNPLEAGDGLVFVKSRLGYLTAGTMPVSKSQDGTPESTLVLLRPEAELEAAHPECDIERFWQLEDVGAKVSKKADFTDEEALVNFHKTVQVKDGRYHVAWPWKTKEPSLPNNYGLALGRLRSTLNKLNQDQELLQEYSDIIQKQVEKGVVELAPAKPEGLVYYVPHHCVIEPEKNTKVRVVYDASSKSRKDASSLNDCLYRGPVILSDLCGLLLRFRLHPVALLSDIEKAFLQVRLQPQERDVARFIWVKDVTKPPAGKNLVMLRFTSVFFGNVSSPFLLGACIDHHLRQVGGEVAMKILENLYVDNVITGENNVKNAIIHYQEAKRLFLGASMNLRLFYTNSTEVRESLAPEDRGTLEEPKVLGIKWNYRSDEFRCSGIKLDGTESERLTKRRVTRHVAELYDPCGWFSPVVLQGKLLVQELWKQKLAWDEDVPNDIAGQWDKIKFDLGNVSNVSLPRYLGDTVNAQLELHAFCDSSTVASAACVYLRTKSENSVTCHLLFSKTRLAPLKPQPTVPKLELVALVMGANLVDFVAEQLHLTIRSKTVWSDSQCVLQWLNKEKLETKFVQRRIEQVRKKKDIAFRFVPGVENPADLPTRGCSLQELRDSSRWWHGPPWLSEDSESWPKNQTDYVLEEKENRADVLSLPVVIAERPTAILNPQKFSFLDRLLRVTAYVQRFVRNARLPSAERRNGPLSVQETSEARRYWEVIAQKQGYPALQQRFTAKILKKTSIAQLHVFRDENGLLRCGSRLSNSNLPYDSQNPVLLPKDHPYTAMAIWKAHLKTFHSGVAQTLVELRQRYWVVQGRSRVKRVIRSCQRCRRIEGGPYGIPKTPALPDFRVTEQVPFDSTGLDYLGFLTVKTGPRQTQKVWVCLFTCAASRAIHLELVENQSADEFQLALRRFVAVHGCPKLIVSDNASQFIAVESAMKKMWKELTSSGATIDWATTNNIDWRKIPEVAPWMGGFYERLVGIVKKSLKKTLDGLCVSLSELRTVLAEVTSIVNSRPLLYVEDDVTSLQLSPADLLGKTRRGNLPTFDEQSAPTTDPQNTVAKVVSAWKRLQAVTTTFWDYWRQGYLTSLREKHANAIQRNPNSRMTYYVNMVLGNPLSPAKTFGEGELILGDVPITSVDMGFNYMKLWHHGKAEEARKMVEDDYCKWQPWNIAHQYVKKRLRNEIPKIQFDLRADRVYEAIIVAQLVDTKKFNPFRDQLDKVIKKADGRFIEFRMYGTVSDRVFTLGYKLNQENELPTEGGNKYGELLTRVTDSYRRCQLDRRENARELAQLLGDINLFNSKFNRSILVITDSQFGHLRSVANGDVYPVGGAKYGDIVNVLRRKEKSGELDGYAYVFVYAGTNCVLSSEYEPRKRDSEMDSLVKVLKECSKKRKDGSVFFSCSVNTKRPTRDDLIHMDEITRDMDRAGIACLNWNQVKNPFFEADGQQIESLFKPDGLHVTLEGFHILWKNVTDRFLKLKMIAYECRARSETIPKSQFYRSRADDSYGANDVLKDPPRSPLVDAKSKKTPSPYSGPSYQVEDEFVAVDVAGPSRERDYRSPSDAFPNRIRSVVHRSRSPRRRDSERKRVRSPLMVSLTPDRYHSPIRHPPKSPHSSSQHSPRRDEHHRGSRDESQQHRKSRK